MHSLADLEKHQVGLKLPQYLIDDIDTMTKQFSINRTDIIIEAVKSYISEQKSKILYDRFETSCKEVKAMKDGTLAESTLGDLIDELEAHTHA